MYSTVLYTVSDETSAKTSRTAEAFESRDAPMGFFTTIPSAGGVTGDSIDR